MLGARPELAWPADAYVEAVEQARGWFQSSLLCATAERGAAPFRNVVSHGLTLDEQGRKMSKSLGNTEDAADVTNRIGADVIRLLYASVDYSADMNIGPTLLNAVAESYRKLRNTSRFLLGNLFDFDPARDSVATAEMLDFDRFILSRLERLKSAVRRAYDHYDFQTAYHQLLNFAVVDLSSLYIDVARDRLYCSIPASRERRSAQTALFNVLDATGADARAADAVHGGGNLFVLSRPKAPPAFICWNSRRPGPSGPTRISKRDGIACSKCATKRSSCSKRCARRERSARRWKRS